MDENTSRIIHDLNQEISEYISFLEKIEALCEDEKINKKIKEFLKLKEVW
jgi:hypothetical protein